MDCLDSEKFTLNLLGSSGCSTLHLNVTFHGFRGSMQCEFSVLLMSCPTPQSEIRSDHPSGSD